MTHWQETGECSICGERGSSDKWVKLTATKLDGVAVSSLDKAIYYYLCPKCKEILDEWTGYEIRTERIIQKIGGQTVTTSRTSYDGPPIDITAHNFATPGDPITVFNTEIGEGIPKDKSTYQVSTDNGKTGLPEVPANKEKIYCGKSLGGVLVDKSSFEV